jgi:hypothetical protein
LLRRSNIRRFSPASDPELPIAGRGRTGGAAAARSEIIFVVLSTLLPARMAKSPKLQRAMHLFATTNFATT